jgi:hypothetical protein
MKDETANRLTGLTGVAGALSFFAGDMLFYGHWGSGAKFHDGMLQVLREGSLQRLFVGGLVGPIARIDCRFERLFVLCVSDGKGASLCRRDSSFHPRSMGKDPLSALDSLREFRCPFAAGAARRVGPGSVRGCARWRLH